MSDRVQDQPAPGDGPATLAAVLGVVGLLATLLGQTRPTGRAVDWAVALLAEGGTVAAVVLGHLGLLRVASSRHRVTTLLLGLVGLALAGGSVLAVVAFGLVGYAGD
ncbi:hypothetical protein G7075_05910 [Phycicoccus sp. HDW14]|uniref:hypothetical protein n=1 Tax=Phycicoccus sp. HDW14 TaxID=2714941 RepID=UPI00140C0DC2|nr:hypothetical protein [Phycicoccus sp. HDW14]QIM20785.1 hypothetical protein G7075_05910 [Phycicoccus sp. HDW14]